MRSVSLLATACVVTIGLLLQACGFGPKVVGEWRTTKLMMGDATWTLRLLEDRSGELYKNESEKCDLTWKETTSPAGYAFTVDGEPCGCKGYVVISQAQGDIWVTQMAESESRRDVVTAMSLSAAPLVRARWERKR